MEQGGAGRGEEARGKEARSGDQMATSASCHGLPSYVILPFNFQLSLHLERGTHHAY